MTRQAFRVWLQLSASYFRAATNPHQSWADELRPHDPHLAALYAKLAAVWMEIREYVMARAEEMR